MNRRRVLLGAAVVMAVLGAVLVFVYAQDAENRAAESLDTVEVLVAANDIAAGESFESFSDGKLGLQRVPSDQLLPGATSDTDEFTDQFARMPIFAGEQLVPSKFGAAPDLLRPDGTTAIPLDLDETARLGPFTQPGSRVTVYATPTDVDVDAAEAAVRRVLEDVLVLSVGPRTLQPGGIADIDGQPLVEVPDNLVIVAVPDAQVDELVAYRESADWTLTLAFADPPPAGDGTE